jgi:transglutaminase-like putative cysteine protease
MPIQYVGPRQTLSGTLPPGDTGTKVTLSLMRDLALSGAKDPVVRETAIGIVRASGAPEHNLDAQLGALFQFVRDQVMFIGDVAGVETLQTPRYTLRTRAGDCDDKAILLAALARSISIPADVSFRAAAVNPRAPRAFSHVYVVANINGRDLPLDPTYKGTPAGFQPRATRREDFRL